MYVTKTSMNTYISLSLSLAIYLFLYLFIDRAIDRSTFTYLCIHPAIYLFHLTDLTDLISEMHQL